MSENKKHPAKEARAKLAAKRAAAKKAAEKKDGSEAQEKIEKMEAEIKTLNEKVLRAMAEMENTRRRAEREAQEARAYSITGFARDMLSVSDNFHRALSALSEDTRKNEALKPFIEGVEMTGRELQNILERHGIKKVNPKGEPFDHNLHQAMFEVETKDFEPGTVMEVIQEGYVIQNRLLRPAMVGVAKAPKEGGGNAPAPKSEKEEKQ